VEFWSASIFECPLQPLPGSWRGGIDQRNSGRFGRIREWGGTATGPVHVLHDRDTFFTVNYGGGLKVMNVLGPIGFRADVRGRTIPNFFRQTMNWPEVTGGLLLSWGER